MSTSLGDEWRHRAGYTHSELIYISTSPFAPIKLPTSHTHRKPELSAGVQQISIETDFCSLQDKTWTEAEFYFIILYLFYERLYKIPERLRSPDLDHNIVPR